MMADPRTAWLGLAAAALGLAGCAGPVNARAIDRICAAPLDDGPACEIAGDGQQTAGPTDDSLGFALDDAGLVVHLAAVPEMRGPGPFDVALLTRAKLPDTRLDTVLGWGSCIAGCPPNPAATERTLPTELAWVTVASGLHGSAPDAEVPYDAKMTFTALDFFIVDLRVTATP